MSRARQVAAAATLDMGFHSGWWGCMNNQEVIMRNPVQQPGLIAHSKALEAAGIAISLVMRVPAPLKSLADQVIRSASSVPANLSEGHGRSGRDRMHHWRIAYASAKEVDTHFVSSPEPAPSTYVQAGSAIQLFDEVRALSLRLLHPKC